MSKIITVFGSSLPKVNEEEYETAYKLGKTLASNGFDICTGGYAGVMEAVSKGAHKKGRSVYGVTVNSLFAKPNEYLTEEIECKDLVERIGKLVELGDAYIVLRGGTGTLVELAMVWEMLNKSIIDSKPVVCHGSMWRPIITAMEKRIKIEKRKTGLIFVSEDIDECSQYIISKLKTT